MSGDQTLRRNMEIGHGIWSKNKSDYDSQAKKIRD